MEKMQQKMGRRLVFFAMPLVGHQNTMFALANILHSRGFSISVIPARIFGPNTAKYPEFSFHFIEDGFSESEFMLENGFVFLNLLHKKCVEPFRECLSKILSDGSSEGKPVACLISDVCWHFPQAVAEDLKLPTSILKTGNVSSFTMYHMVPALEERGHLARRDEQPEDLIPELPPFRVKDIPAFPHGHDHAVYYEFLSNLVREATASKGLVINSIEEIEDQCLAITRQELSIPIFPCGPFHKWLPSPSSILSDQDQSCVSWLDTKAPNSVLYVSFGSLAFIDEAMFHEMAWGLSNSNQPFLWVVRSDLVHNSNGSSHLPEGFLQEVSGRSHIISWAPQRNVLAHPAVGGFWTHNGWNSTLESICEGVPMICSPFFTDQPVNARLVSDVWNVGLQLDKGAKREDMEKAVRKMMAEKEGEEMRERAAHLKKKTNDCLLPGGSSYKCMEDLINFILSF